MFLFGDALSDKIKKVVGGENARLAVAFWGKNAVDDLNLARRKDVQIICDISMGGTNPAELNNLGAPRNENLRHIDNFHAKVYLSDLGAVVTSANASNNGIGFGGKAGLKEAGFYTDQTADIRKWFTDAFLTAKPIDDAALARCKQTWNTRKNVFDHTNPDAQPMSFLDALRYEPGRFGDTTFILSEGVMNPDEEAELRNLASEGAGINADDAIRIARSPTRQWRDFINVHRVEEGGRPAFHFQHPIWYDNLLGVACNYIDWNVLSPNNVQSPTRVAAASTIFRDNWDRLVAKEDGLELSATAVGEILFP